MIDITIYKRNKSNIYFTVLSALFFLCLSVYAIYSISDPYLWYDEAGQFWISKGLNHYSTPFSREGGIMDVIINNRYYNLDPGGFSIILHYWTFISNNSIFLRLLPAIFFMGCCLSIFYLGYKITSNKIFSLILASIPFFEPHIFNFCVELRAYSMEMLGTILGAIMIIKYKSNFTYNKLLLLSLVLSFFCTSRYGFVIVAAVYSLRILFMLYKGNSINKFILKSLLFSLPEFITIMFVYWGEMQFQNAKAEPIGYSSYLNSSLRLFISPLSILFYINIWIVIYKYRKKKSIHEFYILSLLVSSLFFILSCLGVYPWDVNKTISVSLLLLISCFIYFYQVISKLNIRHINIIMSLGYILMITVGITLGFFKRHNQFQFIYKEYVTLNITEYNTIFVDTHINPTLRYLYEYGNLSDKNNIDGYPERFILQNGDIHSFNHLTKKKSVQPQDTICDLYLMLRAYKEDNSFIKLDNYKIASKRISQPNNVKF